MRFSQARSFRRTAVRDIDIGDMALLIDWGANQALRELCPKPPTRRAVWWQPQVAPVAQPALLAPEAQLAATG